MIVFVISVQRDGIVEHVLSIDIIWQNVIVEEPFRHKCVCTFYNIIIIVITTMFMVLSSWQSH